MPPQPRPIIERALDHIIVGTVVPGMDRPCWLWNAWTNQEGYALIRVGSKDEGVVRAHRVTYEHFIGEIPEGLTLDHLCRTRNCVNPWHLEPVTRAENVLRGVGFAPVNAAKTHCPRGHEYTPENTDVDRHGWRKCSTCRRAKNRAAHHRRKLARAAA